MPAIHQELLVWLLLTFSTSPSNRDMLSASIVSIAPAIAQVAVTDK
jgi:hypothetical protein